MTLPCILPYCAYANSPTGKCAWPGDWCPRMDERLEAERIAAERQRLAAEAHWKKHHEDLIGSISPEEETG